MGTAEIQQEDEIWEGAEALALALDRMVEGSVLSRTKFVRELDEIGVNGERVVAGLLATGLLEQGKITGVVQLSLTREGRLAVLHATSVL